MANDNVVNGSDVETKAVFVRTVSQGKTRFRRMPFNLVTRTNNSTGKRETFMELTLGGGHTPGRANSWDKDQGEVYDAIEYYDVYPSNWPKIGNIAG